MLRPGRIRAASERHAQGEREVGRHGLEHVVVAAGLDGALVAGERGEHFGVDEDVLRDRVGGAERRDGVEGVVLAGGALHLGVAQTAARVEAEAVEGVDVVLKLDGPGLEAVGLARVRARRLDVMLGAAVRNVGRPVAARVVAHADVPGAVVLDVARRELLAVVHVLPAPAAVEVVAVCAPGAGGGQRKVAALGVVDRDRGVEEEHVRDGDVRAVEGDVVRADLRDGQRHRERNPHVVAAGGDGGEVACADVQARARDRPAGDPLVARDRFGTVVRVDEGHEEEGALVAAVVDDLTAETHAEGIAVLFMTLVPVPGRVVRVGRNDPEAVAFLHDGLGTADGVLPEGAEVAGAFGGGGHVAGRRRVDHGFKEAGMSLAGGAGRSRRRGGKRLHFDVHGFAAARIRRGGLLVSCLNRERRCRVQATGSAEPVIVAQGIEAGVKKAGKLVERVEKMRQSG